MPKMKTHRGAHKRFKLTKSGLVKRACAYKNHQPHLKSPKRRRRLRKGGFVDSTEAATVKRMLPYA